MLAGLACIGRFELVISNDWWPTCAETIACVAFGEFAWIALRWKGESFGGHLGLEEFAWF